VESFVRRGPATGDTWYYAYDGLAVAELHVSASDAAITANVHIYTAEDEADARAATPDAPLAGYHHRLSLGGLSLVLPEAVAVAPDADMVERLRGLLGEHAPAAEEAAGELATLRGMYPALDDGQLRIMHEHAKRGIVGPSLGETRQPAAKPPPDTSWIKTTQWPGTGDA
jgi:hypothetical protein